VSFYIVFNMILKPKEFKLNEAGSKILIISEKLNIFIYDTNFFILESVIAFKKISRKIEDVILFTEKQILFRRYSNEFFLFNFVSKKFIFSFCMEKFCQKNFFSLLKANLVFFKKKKNFIIMSLIFFGKLYRYLAAKKKVKFLVNQKKLHILVKRCKNKKIKRQMRRKEEKIKKTNFCFFYPLFWEESSPNLYICWDLSSRRKIYEIWGLNLMDKHRFSKISIKNFFYRKNYSKNVNLDEERAKTTIFSCDYIHNFSFFINGANLGGERENILERSMKLHPFFFRIYKKSEICNGFLAWDKKLIENCDLFNSLFKEIDCSWASKKNSSFVNYNFKRLREFYGKM
jgi:hypothetical protein